MSMTIDSLSQAELAQVGSVSSTGGAVLAKELDQQRENGAEAVSLIQSATSPQGGGKLVNTYG